jgi:protocatechuate 3,4-dioxygenase beta subunit
LKINNIIYNPGWRKHMKTQSILHKAGIIILMLLLMAGCAGQPASPTATQAVNPPATSTTAANLPSTAAASPTPPAAAQASATQPAGTQSAAAAPVCKSPASLTPALTEGPFFKANSPERASLIEANTTGKRLTLTGTVLTADCKPVSHALLDFWQANNQGAYDNAGYTLRGHQYTDANGHYQLETIIPGLYTGRTEHIHVKVQAPNVPILTSQLFFPGVTENESDSIYDPALLIHVVKDGEAMQAAYEFIINAQ